MTDRETLSSAERVRAALQLEKTIDDFTDEETASFFAGLGEAMQTPTSAQVALYAALPDAPGIGITEHELFGSAAPPGAKQ